MGFEFNVLYRGFEEGLFEAAGLPGRKDQQNSAITMIIEPASQSQIVGGG